MSSLNSYLMSRISSASLENYFSFARVRCKKITVMELRRAFQNYVKTFFVEVLIGLGNPFLVEILVAKEVQRFYAQCCFERGRKYCFECFEIFLEELRKT